MSTLEKQTKSLSIWLTFDDFTKGTVLRNTVGQQFIELEDVKQQKKNDALLDKLAAKQAKKASKKIMKTIFYGGSPKIVKKTKFSGLSLRYFK